MENLLVIFQATSEQTESLGLAIGLGAVQHGANIRLRHLNPSPGIHLAHAGYGVLQNPDLDWAQGVAIVLEGESPSGLTDLWTCLESLSASGHKEKKWAFVSGVPDSFESVKSIRNLVSKLGFALLPQSFESEPISVEACNEIGRRMAELPVE
jgi:hypothetical protein